MKFQRGFFSLWIVVTIVAIPAFMLIRDGLCKVRGFDGYEPNVGCVIVDK